MTSFDSEPPSATPEAPALAAPVEAEDGAQAEDRAQAEEVLEAETVAVAVLESQLLRDKWLRELPEDIVTWLVYSLPARPLWEWLGEEARGNLRLVLLSGFRATPANVKQPSVTKRLAKHAVTHAATHIDLWLATHEPLLQSIDERDDDSLIELLPALLYSHGGEALLLSLTERGRHKVFEALSALGFESESQPPPPALAAKLANASAQDDASAQGEEAASAAREEASPGAAAQEEAARLAAELIAAELSEAREREAKLQAGLSAALARADKERDKAQLKAREAERASKALENRAATLEAERTEARKLLDRTERRLRHVEREKDELEVDNKRLRRQMRRQQEISEDVRKQLARANAQLEELSPTLPASNQANGAGRAAGAASSTSSPFGSPAASAPRALSPLDREYVLQADRRQLSVTPRQVKQRIDANDEEWAFRLIQALEAVAQVHPEGHRAFLEALKPLGAYYRRVLTADTLRVLVDASNVVRYEKDQRGRGHLKSLLEMREELRRRDCFPIKLIADASLPYFIDDQEEFLAMARRGEVELSAPGQEADEILAREARRTGAYVVTNDRLFFHKATPDFEPPRITFRIIDGLLIVDEF